VELLTGEGEGGLIGGSGERERVATEEICVDSGHDGRWGSPEDQAFLVSLITCEPCCPMKSNMTAWRRRTPVNESAAVKVL